MWKLRENLAQHLFEVGGLALQDGSHPSLLEGKLDLGPHPLDGVELGPIRHVEDELYLISLDELGHLLAVVDPTVVHEHHKLRGLGSLDESKEELYKGIAVDRPSLNVIGL